MADGRPSRFVSQGLKGVTLIPGERCGKPLLQGRSARMAEESQSRAASERPMTKQSLIGAVAKSMDVSRDEAAKVVESVFENIALALKQGQEVRLVGFGTFSVTKGKRRRAPRKKSGSDSAVGASVSPIFKAGKTLRDAVS